jgi:hypothetical protein
MRGQDIVWIIGIDDDAGVIVGAEKEEVGDWYAQVCRYFDQAAPELSLTRVTSYKDRSVVALLFDTSAYPYVVTKGDKKGAFEREVPMREGTRTRSARRSEIVRLFSLEREGRTIEITHCTVEAELYPWQPPSGGEFFWWHMRIHGFAVAGDGNELFLPARDTRIAIDVPGGYNPVEFISGHFLDPGPRNLTVKKSDNDLIITHAGRFRAEFRGTCQGSPPDANEEIVLYCSIRPAAATVPIDFSIALPTSRIAYKELDDQETRGYMLVGSEMDDLEEARPFGRIPDRPSVYVRRWTYPPFRIPS